MRSHGQNRKVNFERSLDQVRKYIAAGELEAAENLARKVTNKKNDHVEVMFLKGCIEYKKGNNGNAIALFEEVLKKDPGHVGARLNYAVALNDDCQHERAVKILEQVVNLHPGHFIAWYNLGNAYRLMGKNVDAKESYLKSIAINPDYDVVYNNLGVVCNRLDQKDEAITYFKKGVSLNADPRSYTQLISSLKNKRSAEAYDVALQVTRLANPGNALLSAFPVFVDYCNWDILKTVLRSVLIFARTKDVMYGAIQDMLLSTNSCADINPDDVCDLHKIWGRMISEGCEQYQGFGFLDTPVDKLRIAYMSSDFRAHSVGFFISNILACHDTSRFEVICYSRAKAEDHVTLEIKKTVHHYHDVSDLNDQELAKRIYDDEIHILIDLAGHTTGTGLTAMRYRPAPVQITYLGYPNTTGLAAVDYRITDSYAETEGGTQYTEKLLKMPQSFICFGKFEECALDPVPPVTRNGYITFASFNNIRKLTPEVVRVWSRILSRVPKSRLIIKAGKASLDIVKNNILHEFSKHGISEERVDLRGHISQKETHLDFYNQVDIALDTFPYNGTTTTCEALWMGVPVITLVGAVHAQRVSYSILKNTGMEDTITFTEEGYIERAVSLSENIDVLKSLRKRIPGAIRGSILCDVERFTRQLEGLYVKAWKDKGYKLSEHFDMDIEAQLAKAREYAESGDLDSAESIAHEMLAKAPDNINALFMLGTIANQKKNYSESIEILGDVINKAPGFLNARINMGATLTEVGRFEDAIQQYQQVLEVDPDNYMALCNLGRVHFKQDRFDTARELLEKSIAIRPDYWISSFNLGSVYAARHDHENAVKWFSRALELEKAPLAYAALIISLVKSGNITEAYRIAKDVLLLKNPGEALVPAWNTFSHMCDWQRLSQIQPQVIELLRANNMDNTIRQTALLGLNAKAGLDPAVVYEIHSLWGKTEGQTHLPGYQHQKAIQGPDKIRIGYLSADFNQHSVGYFIRNIIVSHDPGRFEIYCYSNTRTEDAITKEIKGAVKRFVDVRDLAAEDLARKIHNDGIHILIDLAGHTRGSQVSALCYRPAPVQMTYLGYPNTTGLATVDYRITDPHAEAENGTRYTEQLLYMPESFLCFGKFSDQPIGKSLPVATKGFITFGSFNNVTKLTPEVVRVWSEILAKVPDSKLVIKAEKAGIAIVQQHIFQEFSRNGIASERVELHGFSTDIESHLNFYNQIDIALDTFPYNGTTTTCEALWMGVPVVTLVGKSHAQRVSYSILKNTGIEETIAYSAEEYIRKAVSLASDHPALQSLHEEIPVKIRASILCNPERFTCQFEQLLLDTWQNRESGSDLASYSAINPSQTRESANMTPAVSQTMKHQDQQTGSPATGLWTDYVLKYPYASAMSDVWLSYIDTHMDDEAWKYHQISLNNYRNAHHNNQSQDDQRDCLQQGYQVLYQLADIKGNLSNLQTLARIAIELGEYENALYALRYIAETFETQDEISLQEPFLCVAERFENVDPGVNVGAWVYAAVIYQIENLERLLAQTTAQTTKERLDKIRMTGFLDAELEKWWSKGTDSANTNTDKNSAPSQDAGIRKLHIGGKQAHPEWEIINAVPGPVVDHVGNASDLSKFPDNCFSEIYGSHVLEHFDYARELPKVLKEWYRVLTPGGKLYISVPDLDKLAALFTRKDQLSLEQRFHVMRMIFGGQIDAYDYHKVGLNQEILEIFLKQAGFKKISVVDSFGIFNDTSDYKPYGAAISLNVIAKKPVAKSNG